MTARRGTCPRLAAPMATGDGLLARLTVTRALKLDAVAALCAAARAHGNGIVEVTARGSIQVRGLTAASAADFAASIHALAIADPCDGRVISNPLAGLEDEAIRVEPLADRLRQVLIDTGLHAALGPKVSIVMDGGGALHLDAVPADLRLCAEATPEGGRFRLALGGDAATATVLGTVVPDRMVEAAVGCLEAIAERGPAARARELATPLRLASQFDPPPPGERKRARAPAEPIGLHPLRCADTALGIGLAFGQADATTIECLIDHAGRAGARSIRPAPGRALLIIGVAPDRGASLAATAERLGFIVRPHDPHRQVAACAGAPVCSRAEMPTRSLAPAIAAAAASALDGSITIHLSGCAKGCAHPGAAALTIVGEAGRYGIVVGRSAHDVPRHTLAAEALPAGIARFAAAIEAVRRPGERTIDVIERLGVARVGGATAGEVARG